MRSSRDSKVEHPIITTVTDIFNISEAAAFLSVHEQTLRKLARRGAIPSFKVGRDWRFRREALLRWSEEQQHAEKRDFILIIDDEEGICRAMARIVESLGYRANFTQNAEKGLELISLDVPDLILLDLQMHGMNGPQFLKELRKTQPDIPVIIITGYPDSDLMQQSAQQAPVLLLTKPIDRPLLERTLQSILGVN